MHPRTKIHDIGVGRLAVRRKPGRRMARPLDTRLQPLTAPSVVEPHPPRPLVFITG